MKKICLFCACLALLFTCVLPARAVKTNARAAVVLDVQTKTLLYAVNEDERRSMASTTKIMSAVIVLENADLTRSYRVTAADAAVEGSSLGIQEGDVLSVEALLKALMLVSGNDAAHALANAVSGSQSAFVQLMNQKAKSLGLNNTHFANSSGLTEKDHYSTALDMAYLTAYALNNAAFRRLCSTQSESIDFISPKKRVSLQNHNRLLAEYDGCIGVKTGYTRDAGRCLVSAAVRSGQTLVAVTLDDADDWADHKRMLDAGFEQCRRVMVPISAPALAVVGSDCAQVKVGADEVSLTIPQGTQEQIEIELYLPRFVYAPVKKGEQVGEAVIFYCGRECQRIPLYALSAAQQPTGKKTTFFERILHYVKH